MHQSVQKQQIKVETAILKIKGGKQNKYTGFVFECCSTKYKNKRDRCWKTQRANRYWRLK